MTRDAPAAPGAKQGDAPFPRQNHGRQKRSGEKEELRNMPIIFLTSKDQEQDEIIGLKMGAADYIKKPFSQRLLNERIRTLLRRVSTISMASP